ncbi:Replication initiation protein [termite gut metagenome]|uniref:Replication initiation protein n=1 Tax=termite gut metagenome TaxID=433724 RepID=A0A5J4QPE4_9ZZZZ
MAETKKQVMLAQANVLTQARYNFNTIEKRCLYQIIHEVRRLFVDSNRGQRDLFNNMRVFLTYEQLIECSDNTHLKYVCESLDRLRKRDIEIDNEDIWMKTGYITVVKHHKKLKKYEVEVSSEIMPYLVALAANFTTYDLTVAISLRSSYSQRFYEYCCQYRNRSTRSFFFTGEQLRHMMMLEEKYENSAHLKSRVIDLAQKELKEAFDKGQCDLWFSYMAKDKQRRKILSWSFQVHLKGEEQTPDYQTAAECLQKIHQILTLFFPRDKKFVTRVVKAVQLNPGMAEELAAKMNKKVLDYPKQDIPPILRYVLTEDYGIK